MREDNRVAEVLADWYERRERGLECTPEAAVRDHPDLAEVLIRHFAALEAFERLAGTRAAAQTPETLGEFRILRELGRGGMGVVYEAEQTSMGRRVALKVLYPGITSSEKAVRRFLREARAAGRVHHTNLVPVYGMGEEKGVWFFAMELVSGRPLNQVIEDLRRLGGMGIEGAGSTGGPATSSSESLGPTTGTRAFYEQVARMFAGIAEALEAAHQAGIVHRDVKPSNLILAADGTLKVLDFGLARLEGEGATMTVAGDLLGTPAYMSPEQAGGDGESPDARTDVYSLGATLYELLTLRTPFRGRNSREVCAKILSEDPAAPRRLDRRVPKDLETILLKAMEKERERRYRSAAEMARDLRLFAEGAVIQARRVGLAERFVRTTRRRPLVSSLAVLVLVLASGAGGLYVRSENQSAVLRQTEYDRLCIRGANDGQAGRYDDAEAAYRRAVELEPGIHRGWMGLGMAYWKKKDFPGAESAFRKATVLLPEEPDTWNDLGLTLLDQHRLDDAEAAFLRGIEVGTGADFPRRNLAQVYIERGEFRKALFWLREALDIVTRRPGKDAALSEDVSSCERMAALEAQIEGIQGGEQRPTDPEDLIGLADVCHAKSCFALEAALREAAIEADPFSAQDPGRSLRYNAACAAAQAGCGLGKDTAVDDAARARQRIKAVGWLRADLDTWRERVDGGKKVARKAASKGLGSWMEDSALSGIRDPAGLAKLPEEERVFLRQFWSDVEALLARAK